MKIQALHEAKIDLQMTETELSITVQALVDLADYEQQDYPQTAITHLKLAKVMLEGFQELLDNHKRSYVMTAIETRLEALHEALAD